MGELWGVFYEFSEETWPRDVKSALYKQEHIRLLYRWDKGQGFFYISGYE